MMDYIHHYPSDNHTWKQKTLKKLHDDNLSVGVAIAPATQQVISLQNWAAFQSRNSYSGH